MPEQEVSEVWSQCFDHVLSGKTIKPCHDCEWWFYNICIFVFTFSPARGQTVQQTRNRDWNMSQPSEGFQKPCWVELNISKINSYAGLVVGANGTPSVDQPFTVEILYRSIFLCAWVWPSGVIDQTPFSNAPLSKTAAPNLYFWLWNDCGCSRTGQVLAG